MGRNFIPRASVISSSYDRGVFERLCTPPAAQKKVFMAFSVRVFKSSSFISFILSLAKLARIGEYLSTGVVAKRRINSFSLAHFSESRVGRLQALCACFLWRALVFWAVDLQRHRALPTAFGGLLLSPRVCGWAAARSFLKRG